MNRFVKLHAVTAFWMTEALRVFIDIFVHKLRRLPLSWFSLCKQTFGIMVGFLPFLSRSFDGIGCDRCVGLVPARCWGLLCLPSAAAKEKFRELVRMPPSSD